MIDYVLNKKFIYDNDIWKVINIIPYVNRADCINLQLDYKKTFDLNWVQNKITTYTEDIEEIPEEKDIIIRNKNEKKILVRALNVLDKNFTLHSKEKQIIDSLINKLQ